MDYIGYLLTGASAAATDPATKAAIQAQLDANGTSCIEKMASDLTKYGKYASDSELDSVAGNLVKKEWDTLTKEEQMEAYTEWYAFVETNYEKICA